MPPAPDVHRALLDKWRHAMDLVGPGPLEPHFADAEAAVRGLHAAGAWVDLGSGAGFPGLALAAAWPGAHVTLVERRAKRVAFLETVVREAGVPNATVLHGDADTLAAAAWDGVISRAFRKPEEMIEVGRRLLRPGGTLVLLLAREPVPDVSDFLPFHVERYEIEGRERRSVALRRQVR